MKKKELIALFEIRILSLKKSIERVKFSENGRENLPTFKQSLALNFMLLNKFDRGNKLLPEMINGVYL